MSLAELCTNTVISVPKQASLYEAARLMQQYNIGALVVVDNKDQYPVPCGMVTDRDIAIHYTGHNKMVVSDIMTTDLLLLSKNQHLKSAIKQMLERQVRRAPVVDELGKLTGLVSVDSLIVFLARELQGIANLLQSEHKLTA